MSTLSTTNLKNPSSGSNNIVLGTDGSARITTLADSAGANTSTPAEIASGRAKAWVNFNGTGNTNLSGTYSQSGTTVTVTATAHGLIAGSSINVDATSGTAVDGIYTVATVTDANTFTYTAGTSLTTSGNITLLRNTIRASYNVSSITDNGTGDYTVNFTTALADANYSACGLCQRDSPPRWLHFNNTTPFTTSGVRLAITDYAANAGDSTFVSVAIFR